MTIILSSVANEISQLHKSFTERWHQDLTASQADEPQLLGLVVKQHRFNFDLWHEEDKAREPGAADKQIAQVKRNIDKLNQSRNDTITHIDEHLEENYFAMDAHREKLPWNSETIGSIIDRLSISALKIFHMHEQTIRNDASEQHIASCQQKLAQLMVQQDDLATALQILIDDIVAGRKQNKLYRQFKMYNDPALNPKIYALNAND